MTANFLHVFEGFKTTAAEFTTLVSDKETVHKPYDEGNFDLFLAGDSATAEALILSVTPFDRVREYVLQKNITGHTALFFHALAGRHEVVTFLLGLKDPGMRSLLWAKDKFGQTALHYAESTKVVDALLRNLTPSEKEDFILTTSTMSRTAIHSAIEGPNPEVVQHLMGLLSNHNDPRLLQPTNVSPLHLAENVEIFRCFIDSVHLLHKEKFICALMGPPRYTVLQRMAIQNNVDVVKYMMSVAQIRDSLLYKLNILNCTVLNHIQSEEMALVIVEAMKGENDFIDQGILFQPNIYGQTTFREHALYGRSGVLQILLNELTDSDKLVQERCYNFGRTSLHWAQNVKCAEMLVEAVAESRRIEYILKEDKKGRSCLFTAAEQGRVEVFRYFLFLLEDENMLDDALEKENSDGQSIFHVTYMSDEVDAFHAVFVELGVACDRFEKLDSKGNTPLLYLATRFVPSVFAQGIMAFSLAKRKQILAEKNKGGTSCEMIIQSQQFDIYHYLRAVLGLDLEVQQVPSKFVYREHMVQTIGYDRDPVVIDIGNICSTQRITHYALNEFSTRAAFLLNSIDGVVPCHTQLLKTDQSSLHGLPKVITP